jgi:hypothetical protein
MKLKNTVHTCLVLLSIFMLTIQNAKSEDSTSFVQLRKTAVSIPGWIEQKEHYRHFNAEELFDIIDGGATEYVQQGLKSGIVILLTNKGKSLEIFFEDFGTSIQAMNMASSKEKSSDRFKKISQDNKSIAICEQVIGGCIVYWAKSKYYIEMTLTGYNSLEEALCDAKVFVNSLGTVITE